MFSKCSFCFQNRPFPLSLTQRTLKLDSDSISSLLKILLWLPITQGKNYHIQQLLWSLPSYLFTSAFFFKKPVTQLRTKRVEGKIYFSSHTVWYHRTFVSLCIKYRDWSKYYPRSFLIRHTSKIISGKIAIIEERKGREKKLV